MTFVFSCNCGWISSEQSLAKPSAAVDMLVVRDVAERDPSNEVEPYDNQHANSTIFTSSGMITITCTGQV
jgi:hypothetical protein